MKEKKRRRGPRKTSKMVQSSVPVAESQQKSVMRTPVVSVI